MKIKDTIQKLKEVDLFDEFKRAMEILVKETDKRKYEWDNDKLNRAGLKHNPESYRWNSKEYPGVICYDLNASSFNSASEYTETFKVLYSDDDYKMNGLDFGCIKWNLHLKLKVADYFYVYNGSICEYDPFSHYEYINKVTNIRFSCFHGMTPKHILDVLNGNIKYIE